MCRMYGTSGNMKGCPNCGSTEPPYCEHELMDDGSIGAGVVWICPDCGYSEM